MVRWGIGQAAPCIIWVYLITFIFIFCYLLIFREEGGGRNINLFATCLCTHLLILVYALTRDLTRSLGQVDALTSWSTWARCSLATSFYYYLFYFTFIERNIALLLHLPMHSPAVSWMYPDQELNLPPSWCTRWCSHQLSHPIQGSLVTFNER